MNKIKGYFSEEINRYRFISLVIFVLIITALAWQSDDAYHAYIMARNLVEGNGFVYNIGERATASSCPLFTLVIAGGYFLLRNMFISSLIICIAFSTAAYAIITKHFCKNKNQIILSFIILVGSVSFISYTTAGLENCMLFFLAALFMVTYFENETFDFKRLLIIALLISLIAMTRMDAVLIFAPMAVYVYLVKREGVSFIKAVGTGILGLLPFILWELFATFYFGFPFPNTAYAKLGTNFPLKEYIIRGLQYYFNALLCDPIILLVPVCSFAAVLIVKKAKYFWPMAGVVLYGVYLLYIGGDFMMGRHFTVMFFVSLTVYLVMRNREAVLNHPGICFEKVFTVLVSAALLFTYTMTPVTSQFQFGAKFTSPISDERAGYFKYTSLIDNAISMITVGDMCIRQAWNEQGMMELESGDYPGGVLDNAPGISVYYYPELYLVDKYALADPFLTKLPAVMEDNWRIGHMYRDIPEGYSDSLLQDQNLIKDENLSEYLDIIRLITRGDLFDKNRIQAIIDINLGKYDYLLDNYKAGLDEHNRQVVKEQ